MYILQLDTGYD